MRRIISLVALALVGTIGCSGGPDGWQDKPGPKVIAFFPPIYSLAATVAGDDAQVVSLLTTRGPHDYEPKPSDARRLRRADLFLINGLKLDDALARKLSETSGNRGLRTVKLGDMLPKDMLHEGTCTCGHEHKHDDGKADAHDHDHGFDPHVWLGIPEAVVMVAGIRDELVQLDPAHKDGYAKRAADLTARLQKLQEEGKAMLAAKSEKARLLTHHDSLFYFARGFGAEIVDAIELPGKEPNPKRMQELVQKCIDTKSRLIAVEPQYPSNTGAQTILKELKAKGVPDAAFVELDPLETADAADLTPDFYERRLKANLDNLVKALK